MPKCSECNHDVYRDQNFCPNCGHSIGSQTGSRSQKKAVIIECAYCHGLGYVSAGIIKTKPCPTCGGKGKVRV